MRISTLGLSLALVGLACLAPEAAAQAGTGTQAQEVIHQRTGQEVSQEEILRRLQSSGLTRSQVRNRLLGMGLEPSLADPYFDRIEGRGVGELPSPEAAFITALTRMGLLGVATPDTLAAPPATPTVQAALGPRPDSIAPSDSIPIFGKATFARRTTQFRPLLTGPVPPDYTLGPGDEISLVLTGDVELGYSLPVSREGSIIIPDVGQVFVNGLTLGGLEDRLYERLGRVYSGVRRGADATTRFQVSLGRLRLNEVQVIGEVEYPGVYQVSSLATALDALYQAGGPTADGSFRTVEIRRGGSVVRVLDLYDYLLAAETGDDVRLEQGDVVFVPLAGAQVRVLGAVPRNAVFETTPDETLADVIDFAGGGRAEADLARIRIDRILPPDQRTADRERVLLDVDLGRVRASNGVVPLRDGDEVRVPTIGSERKNRVVIAGSVLHPGSFELATDMTVWDLVGRAGGLRPEAFQPVAHVTRLNPADSTYSLIRVSLERGSNGAPSDNVRLEDQDSVTVFGRPTLETERFVRVEGEVKNPGRFPLADGMTVEDVILSAGGFTERAQGLQVQVARLDPDFQRRDTVAHVFSVSMVGTIPWRVLGRQFTEADEGVLQTLGVTGPIPWAQDVELIEGDRVIVRPLPGYVDEATVEIQGEVQFPGRYPLLQREERLSSLVRRAGGFTAEAYVHGANLMRDSTLVGIDLEDVLDHPGSDADVVLRPDDVLRVPLLDNTVLVRGAVAVETRVIYDSGLSFQDYVKRAGGALAEADEGRANILYANGQRAVVDKRLIFFTDHPDVEPGSTITVPYARQDAGTDWNNVITRGLGIVGSIATILVAVTR